MRSPNDRVVETPAYGRKGARESARPVELCYSDGPADAADRPVVVFLHGSPGSGNDIRRWVGDLERDVRLIRPDLPGFGGSTRAVPDYSCRAHARYVLDLLDQLGVERAHFFAFSMGGGVALNIYDLDPDRVQSLTMMAAIGVQELELLGDYDLNRLLHGLQLAFLYGLSEGFPHFGALDGAGLSPEYARNFFDTDQRPMRALLERFEPPMLLIHGETDFLVLPEVALEHHRIVPQSELVMTEEGHFMPFFGQVPVPELFTEFVGRVERGEARTRADASAPRLARAAEDFDPASVPPVSGPTLVLLMILIALATFGSEDLTCIGVGLIVADGRIPFVAGTAACLVGIFVGDMALYWAGRLFGRPAVRVPPISWMLKEEDLDRVGKWFESRGRAAILLSRFLPGTRLPTYFAAGVVRTNFLVFAFWFLIAAVLWTPALVAFAMVFGQQARESFGVFEENSLLGLLIVAIGALVVVRVGIPLLSWRGRRMLLGSWRRWTRWEFWPPWLFYPPVVLYVLYLAVRHRGLATMTAANPGIEAGGFIGESKSAILRALDPPDEHRLEWLPLAADRPVSERTAAARALTDRLGFPIVFKPDAGQRGSGVRIVRTQEDLDAALAHQSQDALLQEYCPGVEFGVFYVRRPEEPAGRIFSVTEKRLPTVTGDGESTVERLILDDPRHVCAAKTYLRAQAARLYDVLPAGEELELVHLGTHCRGAVFLDGGRIVTPELTEAVDRVSRRFDGFYFGRYDLRGPDEEAFRRGEFRIVELNGLTSEATHIYDPRNSLFQAYRVLFEQWRLAFDIAASNRRRGHASESVWSLLKLLFQYHEKARAH